MDTTCHLFNHVNWNIAHFSSAYQMICSYIRPSKNKNMIRILVSWKKEREGAFFWETVLITHI